MQKEKSHVVTVQFTDIVNCIIDPLLPHLSLVDIWCLKVAHRQCYKAITIKKSEESIIARPSSPISRGYLRRLFDDFVYHTKSYAQWVELRESTVHLFVTPPPPPPPPSLWSKYSQRVIF
jgi:hypothetical protein